MNANRSNTMEVVADRLKTKPEIMPQVKVVGRWLWAVFPTRPPSDIREFLKEQGFIWNQKRGAWQHSCGYFSRHAPYDPREKYGELALGEVNLTVEQ